MKLRIGTRGSRLALLQTDLVVSAIRTLRPDVEPIITPIQTEGDRKQGDRLALHDKKEWVIDLERALLSNSIDLAIHSGKDVPLCMEPGTELFSLLLRDDPRDSFVGKLNPKKQRPYHLDELPFGAHVGTSSVRRGAMLRRARADLSIEEVRGNVPTRLRKLDQSDTLLGIILAEAGLRRLGEMTYREPIPPEVLLPAINQGIITGQCRKGDAKVTEIVESLSFAPTAAAFAAERACAAKLGGDCSSAIGNYAQVEGNALWIRASVYSADGVTALFSERRGFVADAAALGAAVGDELIKKGALNLLSRKVPSVASC